MTVDWSTYVYAQERNILKLTAIDANAVRAQIQFTSQGTPLQGMDIFYAVPASRQLFIDMSDAIRLIGGTSSFVIRLFDANGSAIGSTLQYQWNVRGLVNPEKAIIPDGGIRCNVSPGASWEYFTVVPPSLIYAHAGSVDIKIEMATSADERYEVTANSPTQSPIIRALPGRLYGFDFPVGYDVLTLEDAGDALGTIVTRATNEEKEYVPIRWVSRFGTTKVFYWEFRNVKVSTDGAVAIENVYNQYDIRKGYVEGFTAHLEGLDAYDYWYYSDIVTSSKVEVFVKGSWYQVEVSTKDYSVPNTSAGEPSELNVDIKLRRYDAL